MNVKTKRPFPKSNIETRANPSFPYAAIKKGIVKPIFIIKVPIKYTPNVFRGKFNNFPTKYDITNFGAILFAKDLTQFDILWRKAPRIIFYKGNHSCN